MPLASTSLRQVSLHSPGFGARSRPGFEAPPRAPVNPALRRDPLAAPRTLQWAALLSLLLHLALLLGFVRPHLSSSSISVLPAFQTRMVPAAATAEAPTEQATVSSEQPAAARAEVAPAPQAKADGAQAAVAPKVNPAASAAVERVAPAGLPPAPSYREAKGLEPPPALRQYIEPLYPEAAGLQEGSVVLRLLISSSGDVDDAAVVRSTPRGLFDQAALTAWRQAKFTPGYFLGIAVQSQITIQVDFTPINRGGAVSGQSR